MFGRGGHVNALWYGWGAPFCFETRPDWYISLGDETNMYMYAWLNDNQPHATHGTVTAPKNNALMHDGHVNQLSRADADGPDSNPYVLLQYKKNCS